MLGLSFSLVLASCGYRLGYRSPPSVQSVAVPIFDNRTFPLRRDIEYDVTSALRRELQARTPLRLVDSESADMVVHGAVSEFEERVVAEGRQDETLESSIRITVDLLIEDRVNGRSLPRSVRDTEPFSIARGETIEVARRRAIDNLAEKILIALEAW